MKFGCFRAAVTSRRVGMADEADSKSVAGDRVWVQVPSPAEIADQVHDLICLWFYRRLHNELYSFLYRGQGQ